MSATTIGQPRRRRDGEPKVRGPTRYTADLPVHGLLHGRLVLSAEAHARLTGVDASAALEVPGVVAVLTAGDLPLGWGARGRPRLPPPAPPPWWGAGGAAPGRRWRARRSCGQASRSPSWSPRAR